MMMMMNRVRVRIRVRDRVRVRVRLFSPLRRLHCAEYMYRKPRNKKLFIIIVEYARSSNDKL